MNKGKPMISIVIPVYNSAQFIAIMLDSILNQTYKNIELILVNDGSSDNSSEICHQYASKYSCISVYDCENKGASAARNFGLEKARGEFIWFMDSDDVLPSDALEIAVKAQQVSDTDVVIGGMNFCFFEKNKIVVKSIDNAFQFTNTEFSQYYSMLFLHNYISSLCNKLIRRSIIMRNMISMQNRLSMYEDYVFCMDLLTQKTSVLCIPDILYNYQFRNSESLSHRYKPHIDEMFSILKTKISHYIDVFDHKEQEADMYLNDLMVYLAYECVKNEFRALENPKQKVRDLLHNRTFCEAMHQFRGYRFKHQIVHLLMKYRVKAVLLIHLTWYNRNNKSQE